MATFVPHPRLRSRVAAIELVERVGTEVLILPSTGVVLGLQFRGRVAADKNILSVAGVTGIQGSARKYTYLGTTGSVLVRFTPQGASSLGVPVGDLNDQNVPLDELLSRPRVAELTEQLEEATDEQTRVTLVERCLLELPFTRDPLVSDVTERLSNPEDSVSLAAIAKELGISARQLERRFVARVGVPPKRFARLARFERALSLVSSAPSLTAAAQEAGYYDQSHLVREFRAFAGMTPSTWLGRR